jgi:hypothetical protein
MGFSCIGVEAFQAFWDDVVSTGKVTDVSMNFALGPRTVSHLDPEHCGSKLL